MDVTDIRALRQHIIQQRDSIWEDLDTLALVRGLDAAHTLDDSQGLPINMLALCWIFLSL